MPEKLNAAFQRLQTLGIQPTLENLQKLLQSLYDIREVYDELMKMKGAETDGKKGEGPADHPGGQHKD